MRYTLTAMQKTQSTSTPRNLWVGLEICFENLAAFLHLDKESLQLA